MTIADEPLRLEFEVWRLGGDNEAEGILLPRKFEPDSFDTRGLAVKPGTLIGTSVESAGPNRFRLHLSLKFGRFGPGPRPDWHTGELTLSEEGGSNIGAAPFTFYAHPAEVAVQTIVPDHPDRAERTGVDLGVFVVAIRVPYADEWTWANGYVRRVAVAGS